jgi:pimeloyl-ACP methyl ester carboxylesterase
MPTRPEITWTTIYMKFEADGAAPLPPADAEGHIDHAGARIWYSTVGSGPAVVLLHGALGNSADWGYQVRALVDARYRVVLIDNRGRGRSTIGAALLSYELMSEEVLAVMDALNIEQAAVVGWSDGAIIGLVLAITHPSRVTSVFAFAGNMDLDGVKPDAPSDPKVGRVFRRAGEDYARLSDTPGEFRAMSRLVGEMMKTQPNYSPQELAGIRTRVAIVIGENDEFIKSEHAEYLARSIPDAKLIVLPGVSHFAPLQRPDLFNDSILAFLNGEDARGGAFVAGQ